jgi:hypothetical protein
VKTIKKEFNDKTFNVNVNEKKEKETLTSAAALVRENTSKNGMSLLSLQSLRPM